MVIGDALAERAADVAIGKYVDINTFVPAVVCVYTIFLVPTFVVLILNDDKGNIRPMDCAKVGKFRSNKLLNTFMNWK